MKSKLMQLVLAAPARHSFVSFDVGDETSAVGYMKHRNTSVAQGKRNAIKRRNQVRNRKAHRG